MASLVPFREPPTVSYKNFRPNLRKFTGKVKIDPVVVGLMEIALKFSGTESLKDKRRILRSLLDRARNDFHVAIAEVDDQDLWGNATLGVACISNDAAHAESILEHVRTTLEAHPEVEVFDVWREVERR